MRASLKCGTQEDNQCTTRRVDHGRQRENESHAETAAEPDQSRFKTNHFRLFLVRFCVSVAVFSALQPRKQIYLVR